MTTKSRVQIAVFTAIAIALATARGTYADPTKCKQGIAKSASKYVQGRTKALQKCEDGKVKGSILPTQDCNTEAKVLIAFPKLHDKLFGGIAKACGGADKVCGAGGDDDPLSSIGWASVPACPNLESFGCSNAINNCADISTCLECTANGLVGQAIDLYYAAMNNAEFGTGSTVNKCQQAIGKSTAKFLSAKSKILQKCWDARLKAKHSNPCPNPGDGKAVAAITTAEAKKVSGICKACGGPDKLCDNTADVTPAQIGFVASCPNLTPPGGSSCADTISTANDIVECVDCITEFKVDCIDALAVPQFVSPVPAECQPNTTTTTSSSTSTSTSTTSTSTSSTSTIAPVSTTTTSTSTTTTSTSTTTTLGATTTTSTSTTTTSTSTTTTLAPTTTTSTSTTTTSTSTTTTSTSTTTTTTIGANPSFLDFTTVAGVSNCGQTYRNTTPTGPILKNLSCGGLDLGGGSSTVAEGPTPDGATSRFTTSCVGPACTLGPTLTDGAGFKCTNTGCVFGTPLPIVNGTLSTCVQNLFSSPASGTLNTSTGVASVSLPLTSVTVVTGNATQPCPICRIGTPAGAPCTGTPASPCTGQCEGSPNQGAVCTSTNSQALTNDCPIPASSPAGNRCYKGSNNNGACTVSGECPGGVCTSFVGNLPVNLTPLTTGLASMSDSGGIFCTQKRCLGGTNYGNTCTVDADCPGTTAVPRCVAQTAAQVGAFFTNVCLAGANSGLPCTVATQATDCPGSTCRLGNVNNMCAAGTRTGLGCTAPTGATGCGTNAACTGGPGQGTCGAGDVCTSGFCAGPAGSCVRAGTLARLIQEQGTAPGSLLPIGTSHAGTLASVFCIPAASTDPNGSGAGFLINGAANIPGPGATSLPGSLKLQP